MQLESGPKSCYEVLFGRLSNLIRQVPPFGCQMVCRPFGPKVDTFGIRAFDGICMSHNGGGICRVGTKDKFLQAKRVRAIKHRFSVFDLFTGDSQVKSLNAINTEVYFWSIHGFFSALQKTRGLDTEEEDQQKTEKNITTGWCMYFSIPVLSARPMRTLRRTLQTLMVNQNSCLTHTVIIYQA